MRFYPVRYLWIHFAASICLLSQVGCVTPAWPSAKSGGSYGVPGGAGSAKPSSWRSDPAEWGSSIASGAKQVGEAITAPFQPRVEPAEDPASLASMPDRVGPRVYLQLAATAEQQRHGDVAGRYYAKAREVAPEEPHVLIACARFYDRQGRTQEALDTYRQAWKHGSRDPVVLNDLGLFHARHSQWDRAREFLDQAVAHQPGNLRYRNNLARVWAASGQADAAVATLEPVLPASQARFNVACMLQEQGRDQDAIRLLQQAVELDPDLKPASEMLARYQAPPQLVRLPDPARGL